MHYHPITDANKEEMLREMNVSSFEELLRGIPASLRKFPFELPETLSEHEVLNLVRRTLEKNTTIHQHLSFLGGGSYDHFVPSAVGQIISRSEFYTAYTPYQPEASQGTLQAIFEFQSLMAELTGLDVSNASHYDGATSLAEAALLALRHTDRPVILVSKALHPHYRQTLETYLKGTPFKIQDIPFSPAGDFDREKFTLLLSDQIAGAIFQTPNFFGVVENLEGISEMLHEKGSLLVLAANPLSLGVLRSPAEWGADVAVGEGQPLGIKPQFGGPYLGFFTLTKALMRRIPGRLCGITQDSKGRRAYVLTLKAREQDIRRERASSNICTNQALCALMACVYMTLMGKQGMREVGQINIDRAYYLREEISKIPGFSVHMETSIFNEFTVKSKHSFQTIEKKCLEQKIFPGIDLGQFFPEKKNEFLVCATETKSQKDLDRFVEVLKQC